MAADELLDHPGADLLDGAPPRVLSHRPQEQDEEEKIAQFLPERRPIAPGHRLHDLEGLLLEVRE